MLKCLYVVTIIVQVFASFTVQAQTIRELSADAGLSGEHRDHWSTSSHEPFEISPSKHSVFYPILKLSYFGNEIELVDDQQKQLDAAIKKCDRGISEISVRFGCNLAEAQVCGGFEGKS